MHERPPFFPVKGSFSFSEGILEGEGTEEAFYTLLH